MAYRSLAKSAAPAEFRPRWELARTVAAIGVFSAVVAQVDRLVVSRLLPLADFGAYAVAVTIGGVVATIATPIHATAFPRFAQLLAGGDDTALRQAFRDATHVFAITVVPTAVVAAFFSRELIGAWTGDAALAETLQWVAAIIAAGSAFYAAMSLPYALQLAHGWLTPSIVKTLGSMILLVPATIWGVWRFGAAGAAGAWLAVNALALAYDVVATHRRLLPGALWRWFSRDAALPAIAVIAACAVARKLFDAVHVPPLAVLALAGLFALSAAALTIRAAARPGTPVRSSPR
jgi:O-antigen/teichoic acid export membrane protein